MKTVSTMLMAKIGFQPHFARILRWQCRHLKSWTVLQPGLDRENDMGTRTPPHQTQQILEERRAALLDWLPADSERVHRLPAPAAKAMTPVPAQRTLAAVRARSCGSAHSCSTS